MWVVVFAPFLRDHNLSAGAISLELSTLTVVAILVITFVSPRLEPLPRHASIALALGLHAIGAVLVAKFHGGMAGDLCFRQTLAVRAMHLQPSRGAHPRTMPVPTTNPPDLPGIIRLA